MTEPAETLYDVVPYPSKAYAYAHPDRLEVVARLFDMQPAPVHDARVLELGCGEGGHLLPIASRIPGATFVGIDLAPTAIDKARAGAEALGLGNVEFLQADIAALPAGLGSFDYIISHGVFSWIPEGARQGMMRACRDLLRPQGVAYISYNTYPGWHLHNVARGLMRLRAEQYDDPAKQIEQSMALLRYFGERMDHTSSAYAHVLSSAAKLAADQSEAYVFHDFMAPINDPVLFRDFAGRATSVGLQYLGDADLGDMLPSALPEELGKIVQGISDDLISLGQYMDFVRGTGFRRSLIVHGERVLDRHIQGPRTADLLVTMRGNVKESGEVSIKDHSPVAFESGNGNTVTVTSPIGKAGLFRLVAMHPREVRVSDLYRITREWMGLDPDDTSDLRELGGVMVHAFSAGLVDMVGRERGYVCEVSDRPVADPYSRLLALQGAEKTVNVRHEIVTLSRFHREVLTLLDGEHDVEQITAHCIEAATDGRLTVKLDDEPTADPEEIREAITASVPPCLDKLAGTALLIG